MASSTYDLIIVGAGPAGSATAITAASFGASVLLLERGNFPRQKVCGEFTSAESLSLLTRLLGDSHQHLLHHAVRIRRARVFMDDRVMETAVNPPASSIARLDLDVALWESAKQVGVEALSQVVVQEIKGHGPFQVSTSGGSFEARALVNASGRWSNLTADPSAASLSPKWIGLKAHYSTKGKLDPEQSDATDLYFFEGGYCGVQPVRLASDKAIRINACAMVRADVASSFPELFEQHSLLRQEAESWTPLFNPIFTAPLLFRKPAPLRGNVLMVGDAAGFVDPFVGDGISLALRGGALAAECLRTVFSGEVDLNAAAKRYRDLYQKQLAPIFGASSTLRRMLRLPRTIRKPIISLVNANPGIARFVVGATR